MATALNPDMVKNRPVSNWNDRIGATAMPPIAAMHAASVKLRRVMRGTSIPMSRAAAGFSEHARSASPSAVRMRSVQMQTMMASAAPAIQNPCVGSRMPSTVASASPEKGGSAYGWLPHTTRDSPSSSVSRPAVRMKRLLVGSRESAGTNALAPITRPSSVVASVAPIAASQTGQPNETSSEYMARAPRMQNAPCERLIAPVTRKTRVKPSATTANTLPCSSPPMTI